MTAAHTYLEFTIKALDMVNMWPSEEKSFCRVLKEYYILVVIAISTFPLKADFVIQFYDEDLSFTSLVESVIAVSALYSVIYISICFASKKFEIKDLIENLNIFEEFCPISKILETEEHVTFYTKFFITYGIIGNICYAILPVITFNNCNANKSKHMIKHGISCGLIARYILPFKYDYAPYFVFVMIEEFFVCCLGTTIVMMITMLVCGILTHLTANLQLLKSKILQVSNVHGEELKNHVKWCVKYHTAIIEYSDKTNDAFSVMMLVHISWTSFIISVLGFEIIMETNYINSLRFVMHLAGWLGMLYIVCYYGQTLMDKSCDISEAVYDTKWYEKAGKVRDNLRLILLRSQRPLVLKAAGVKVMSLSTFLGVLSTAYSYFTLLLKIKP